MTKKDFDLLVEKYQAGICTKEEEELIEKWAELHYQRQNDELSFESQKASILTETKIWNIIKYNTGLTKPKTSNHFPRHFLLKLTAVAAIVIVAIFFWTNIENQTVPALAISGIETKNVTAVQQRILLPDSSEVMLDPGALIIVSDKYGQKKRSIYLDGQAFFNVKHNPQLPFFVFTGELVTEVLGTSFWIKPQKKNKMIEVSVVTGKVSVYTESKSNDKKQNGVIAKPNQKVVYNTELKTIIQDLVVSPEIITPPPKLSSFIFEDTSLKEVLELMQISYGVDILVGTPLLNGCMFTGDLSGLGLYEQLDHLCEVLHAKYTIRGTTIFISGNGCA